MIRRDLALKIIQSRLKVEERKLRETTNEYKQRVVSYSIAILRDLYDMVVNIEEAK